LINHIRERKRKIKIEDVKSGNNNNKIQLEIISENNNDIQQNDSEIKALVSNLKMIIHDQDVNESNKNEKEISEEIDYESSIMEEKMKDNNKILDNKRKPIIISDKNREVKKEEYNPDYSELEAIKIDLEKKLGIDLFRKVYRIIEDLIPLEAMCFNQDIISQKINSCLKSSYQNDIINLCNNKIPEIFSLLIMEREAHGIGNYKK